MVTEPAEVLHTLVKVRQALLNWREILVFPAEQKRCMCEELRSTHLRQIKKQ